MCQCGLSAHGYASPQALLYALGLISCCSCVPTLSSRTAVWASWVRRTPPPTAPGPMSSLASETSCWSRTGQTRSPLAAAALLIHRLFPRVLPSPPSFYQPSITPVFLSSRFCALRRGLCASFLRALPGRGIVVCVVTKFFPACNPQCTELELLNVQLPLQGNLNKFFPACNPQCTELLNVKLPHQGNLDSECAEHHQCHQEHSARDWQCLSNSYSPRLRARYAYTRTYCKGVSVSAQTHTRMH